MSRTNLFRAELSETNDAGGQQLGKGRGYAGEEVDKVHIVRQHGLASHAPKGSHGIGIAGSGERSLVAFLGMEHADKRPRDLKEGQATLYDATGNAVRMQGDDGVWHDAGARPQKMSGKTLEFLATDTVTIKVGGTSITMRDGRIDLGGPGGSRVMTESGPSSTVYAKL